MSINYVMDANEHLILISEFVSGWLGAMSTGVALLISPVTIAFCRRKSTRVTAVMGGLITALGCLFTSFATQFHQLFFRYIYALFYVAEVQIRCLLLRLSVKTSLTFKLYNFYGDIAKPKHNYLLYSIEIAIYLTRT